ncbi:hypothetical protein DV515_00000022, partial [Chloebia gouldiae]
INLTEIKMTGSHLDSSRKENSMYILEELWEEGEMLLLHVRLEQNSIFSSKIGFDLKYAVVTVAIDSGWEEKCSECFSENKP